MLQMFSFASVLATVCIVGSVTLKPNSPSGAEWIYSYHASTSVGNNLSTDISSQWTLSARLTIQSFKKYKIFKLEDVKTSGFNGLQKPESHIEEFGTTKNDTKILEEGFLVEYQTENSFDKLNHLKFSTEDPEWSRNIKRGIASIYQIDLQKFVEQETQYPIQDEEKNIYGTCKIVYNDKTSQKNTDSFDISKKMNNANCINENTSKTQWNSTPLGYYNRITKRYYSLGKKVGPNDQNTPLKNIKTNTIFSYWLMNSDRSIHEVKQTQELTLEKVSKLSTTSDVSKYTQATTPFYNFHHNHENEPLPNEEIQNKWLQQYEQIKKQINHNTSLHFNEERFHVIEKLRKILQAMNLDGLNTFKSDNYSEPQMQNIFSSMLPYIGTESSVNYIIESITSDNTFNLAHLRLLALFPLYVEDSIEAVLENMEKLLTMDIVKNDTIKQNFILSFANMVYQSYFVKLADSNSITEAEIFHKRIAKKYIDKYFQLFTETTVYSLRMKYLLGMMNMGQYAIDNLVKIVKNTAESRHCRTLAVYSIKPELLNKKHEVYNTFWPIVKNSSEPFELRAAALSLLLASNINSSEMYSILSYMNRTSYDPAKQQLHNYFYTSVLSGKTDCEKCTIKNLAKTMLDQLNSPETNQGLLTSYHQVSYSDRNENFKTTLNLHVVANPVTNFVNVFKLTLNHFNSHQKTGEFAVYIKAEGISSKLYKEEYERHYAIKELYKILEEMKIISHEDLSENLHIEIGLFYEKRAVFALHINIDNVDEMSDFIDQTIIYIGNNDIITIRDVRSLQFSSDVGTPLYMSLNYQHILGTEFKNYDKIFLNRNSKEEDDDNYVLTRIRSIWNSKMNLVSYNPLTKMSHGVSRIFSNQNFVKFKIDYNVYDLSLRWNDNTSYFDTLIDHKYVVFVNNENGLKELCEKCEPVVFLGETHQDEKGLDIWLWVKNIIVKETNYTAPRFGTSLLHDVIKESNVSYTGLPFAQPFVLLCYLADYLYYIPQYDISSLSINTERIVKEPNLSTLKITFINDALDENYKLNLNFNITLALAQQSMPAKKLLNQWNLNLQRQELNTGVYYELHYDDKDKSVKFDVHSDLDYVPTTPDTDMFSLKPAEPIISRTAISLEEKGVVPTSVDVISLFSVSDDQIVMMNNSKSFQLCQKDYESEYFKDILHNHTPPTKWCYNASIGLSTYDNYAIYIQFKNVSKKIRKVIENDLLRPIRTLDLAEGDIIKHNSFNVSMVYSALHSVVNIEVEKDHVVNNYSVPDLVRPWALLKPTSRLIDELRYNVFGLDNVCIIIPKYVISFTGKIIEHDVDSPIIPLIECTNTSRLGLTTNRFTYKLWSDENTFQMGKKEGGYYVMRNGKYLKKSVRAEDYVVNLLNDHTFHITTSRIDLYYNGEYLTIKLKSAFINRMCGMCTTTEFVAPNMMNKYFN